MFLKKKVLGLERGEESLLGKHEELGSNPQQPRKTWETGGWLELFGYQLNAQ